VVHDVSGGCGSSFSIKLVDPDLAKLPKLQGQRAVYKALGDLMKTIHAVQVQISAE
jgi:stress-induced morphogen